MMDKLTALLPKNAVTSLKKVLSEKRYQHCVRVMKTSFEIFEAWNQPDEKRETMAWASLFHDCAKENPPAKMEQWIEKGPAPYGMDLLDSPGLVHATVGTIILQQEYDIYDDEILTAVAYHSTGHADQSPIGWIVYLADILEPGRTFIEGRKDYLRTAKKDPLEGLRRVTELRHKISGGKGRDVHPTALQFKEHLNSVSSWHELIEASALV
jgi:predicted HD superfamily hydrolase involved in NAD metabolism